MRQPETDRPCLLASALKSQYQAQNYAIKIRLRMSDTSVAVLGNYFNNHQLPVAKALLEATEGHYCFIALDERSNGSVGRDVLNGAYDFVFQNQGQLGFFDEARRIIENVDIAVIGDSFSQARLFERRLMANKLTFFAAERILKRGGGFRYFPPKAVKTYRNFGRYSKYGCLHCLCQSAFLPLDFKLSGIHTSRMWKWGYFPETAEVAARNLTASDGRRRSEWGSFATEGRRLNLLWLARLIGWKRPEISIEIARRLSDEGIDYHLVIAGEGDRRGAIEDLVCSYGLCDSISFVGGLSPEDVGEAMDAADIYLFTPDRNEGWGATLNEAMAHGCAVVASSIAGSTPYLVNDEKNALVFDWDSVDSCYACVKRLALDEDLRMRISFAAQKTIRDIWNGGIAARRLLQLSEALAEGLPSPFLEGPCSKAPIVEDEWCKKVSNVKN